MPTRKKKGTVKDNVIQVTDCLIYIDVGFEVSLIILETNGAGEVNGAQFEDG